MSISEKDIQHIADLARLGIPKKEIPFFAQELSSILQYIEKLNQVSVDEKQAEAYITSLHSQSRADAVRALWGLVDAKQALGQACKTHNKFIQTKPILDKTNE